MSGEGPGDIRVLVSGATGFIASHVVRELLAAGYRVRGTVRRLDRDADHRHLRELPGAERLELVQADLIDDGAFADAVEGCRYVQHVASPYVLTPRDVQRDLVEPAVKGTRSMLEACARAPSVERVVLTSSMAAVTDEPGSDRALTEEDWNEKSSVSRNPYYYSKTMAERAAWTAMEELRPSWGLVAINPYLVVGPSLSAAINVSNQIFVDLLTGVFPGIIRLTWGVVDVRDVALAHVRAMTAPAASGRYVCACGTIAMRDVVGLLARSGFDRHKLPRIGLDSVFGDYAARLGAVFQPRGVRQYLATHIGRVPLFDNRKIKRDLAMEFRPLETTILDTVGDLVRWGHVRPPRAAERAASTPH